MCFLDAGPEDKYPIFGYAVVHHKTSRVVQMVTMSGTNTGGFMGLPPTGKHFSFPAVLIFTLRDGRIVRERRIYDFTGFLMEIGVLKAKPL